MNTKNFIIGLLILLLFWLIINKVPKTEHIKYIEQTVYEDRVDTLLITNTEIKTKIKIKRDTITKIKDSLIYYRFNADTVKLIKWQDSLIVQQDSVINWQDSLITNLDTVVINQSKAIDFYKDSILNLNDDLVKSNKKRKIGRYIQAGLAIFAGTIYLTK